MPTKTVSLSDVSYDILRTIPKGEHSSFVDEAIKLVTYSEPDARAHVVGLRLAFIDRSLMACYARPSPMMRGDKKKSKRFNAHLFDDFMMVYLDTDRDNLSDAIKAWLGDKE